ncbi:hypothetical protein F5B20DRAFT_589653 [Whalleya microplaca]|nr:hypothetical protein F5B20DRAFT_589653 [Whalleya microplaca]
MAHDQQITDLRDLLPALADDVVTTFSAHDGKNPGAAEIKQLVQDALRERLSLYHNALQAQIKKAESDVEKRDEHIAHLEAEMLDWQSKKEEDMHRAREDYEKQVHRIFQNAGDDTAQIYEDAQKANAQVEDQITTLTNAFNTLRTQKNEYESKAHAYDNIEAALTDKTDELERLKNNDQKIINGLKRNIQDAEDRRQMLETLKVNYDADVAAARREGEADRDRLRLQSEAIKQTNVQLKVENKKLHSSLNTVQGQKDALVKERDNLQQQRDSLQDEIEKLQHSPTRAGGTMSGTSLGDELSAALGDNSDSDSGDQSHQVEELQGKLDAVTIERDNLKNEKKAAEKQHESDAEKARKEKEEAEKRYQGVRSQNNTLRNENATLKQSNEQLQHKNNELEKKEKDLTTQLTNQAAAKPKGGNEDKHLAKIQKLKKELEALKNNHATQATTLNGLQDEKEKLKRARDALEQELYDMAEKLLRDIEVHTKASAQDLKEYPRNQDGAKRVFQIALGKLTQWAKQTEQDLKAAKQNNTGADDALKKEQAKKAEILKTVRDLSVALGADSDNADDDISAMMARFKQLIQTVLDNHADREARLVNASELLQASKDDEIRKLHVTIDGLNAEKDDIQKRLDNCLEKCKEQAKARDGQPDDGSPEVDRLKAEVNKLKATIAELRRKRALDKETIKQLRLQTNGGAAPHELQAQLDAALKANTEQEEFYDNLMKDLVKQAQANSAELDKQTTVYRQERSRYNREVRRLQENAQKKELAEAELEKIRVLLRTLQAERDFLQDLMDSQKRASERAAAQATRQAPDASDAPDAPDAPDATDAQDAQDAQDAPQPDGDADDAPAAPAAAPGPNPNPAPQATTLARWRNAVDRAGPWLTGLTVLFMLGVVIAEGRLFSAWVNSNAATRAIYMIAEDKAVFCIKPPSWEFLWEFIALLLTGVFAWHVT